MKIININKSVLPVLFALVLFAGCNEGDYDTGWTQEPPYSDAQRVYFANDNPTSATFVLSETDDFSILLNVGRNNTEAAASVPIKVLSGGEYFNVPATVDFSSGASTATLRIEYTGMASIGTVRTLELQLEDTPEALLYTNNRWTGTAVASRGWIPYYKDVYSYWSATYAAFYQDIEVYDGTANFRIKDFLNSGEDLRFTLYRKDNGEIVTANDLNSGVSVQCGVIVDPSQATFDGSYWYTWNINLYPTLADGSGNGELLAGEGMYGSGPDAADYLYLCYMWIGLDVTTNCTVGSFCFYLSTGYNYFTWYNYAKPAQ
jgi:hypothetical protein